MMKKTGMQAFWLTIMGFSLLAWLTACAGTTGMMDESMDTSMHGEMKSPMHDMLMGSGGHHASGNVAVGMGMNNTHVLTLSDIKVDNVPDGYVYLTRNGDWMHGVELGMLKQFTGSVSFTIPAGVNPEDFDSVVIWCRQFKVEIGRAYLSKKIM
jgi:hypothetical protein